MPHHTGPHGEASVFDQQAEAVKGKQGLEPLLFPTGDTRRGRGNSLGLASLMSAGSGLERWSLAVYYLVLGELGREVLAWCVRIR